VVEGRRIVWSFDGKDAGTRDLGKVEPEPAEA